MAPDGRWSPARLGIRSRTTVAAVIVVGIALVVGAAILMAVTRTRIESSIRDAAVARAESLAALVEAGAVTEPLPGRDLELASQVVDPFGVVVATDLAAADLAPFTDRQADAGQQLVIEIDELFEDLEETTEGLDDEGPYVVVVQGVTLDTGPGSVQVAASLEDAADALDAALPALGIGMIALLAVVGLTTWALTGRALRPIDEMRTEAERISAAALGRRLPIPGAHDEIQRLAITLNEMLARLEQSASRQRRFVADASHELKSPLAAIRAMVDVAARDPVGVNDEVLLADLDAEIDRMQRLVADLLYLARADEPEASMHRTAAVELDRVLADEATALRSRSSVAVETAFVPVRIVGDAGRIGQLARNLTDNAARHAATTVWLRTEERTDRAVIIVRDDGPGVPREDRGRIFERFVRLDESRARDTGGAGLGLAVAQAIARDHGGDLNLVDSDRGAAFEAWFPSAE